MVDLTRVVSERLREEGGGNLIIPMRKFHMRRTMKPRSLEEKEDLLTRLTLLLTSLLF